MIRPNLLILSILGPLLTTCTDHSAGWQTKSDGVLAMSSPRAADLNGDGVKDIVLGGGADEWERSDSAVLAFDGQTGAMLWHASGRNQFFGSATFLDINRDGTPDVIIGGRSAELQAINGKNGHKLWEFFRTDDRMGHKKAGWFNFTNAQLLPDQDRDGLPDLLIANGGDATIGDVLSPRPVGRLLVLSSGTGRVLHDARVPDGKETYCSPVLVKNSPDPARWILLFGTGGEAIGGHFYKATLGDLLQNDLSKAKILVTEATKGIVAPPLVGDLNADGTPDYVISTVAARTLAIDGKTDRALWGFQHPDAETYSMPTVGYFTGPDRVPDFFVCYAVGTYPQYERGIQFLLDGATGRVVDQFSTSGFTYASPLTVDLNNDGHDDALVSVNYTDQASGQVSNQLVGYDFWNKKRLTVGQPLPGANFAITPYLGDLDNDGNVDVLYGALAASTVRYPGVTAAHPMPRSTCFARQELAGLPMTTLRWGAYMGETGNANFLP